MPLILITGVPCSGKSLRTKQIKEFFDNSKKKQVFVVSENEYLDECRNQTYSNANKEKMLRGKLKSEVSKKINSTDLVILDGMNYIKGYRYELYCLAKKYKSQYCLVQCLTPHHEAKRWNAMRSAENKYSEEMMEELIMRHESPNSSNRWDSPLYTVLPEDEIPLEQIYEVLFEKKPPSQNKSTELQPLSSNNFLHEIDKNTQEVVKTILAAQKLGHQQVSMEGCSEPLLLKRSILLPELSMWRRQFLVYIKEHPVKEAHQTKGLFMQYISKLL